MKPRIVVLAGPTASGKTALSLALAKRFPFEIVSADSMQVYRGMDIATAKPSPEEREGIPHHMIDVADPALPFTVSDYVRGALAAVGEIGSREKIPLVVGGTGFYIKALLEGGEFREDGPDAAYRRELEEFAHTHGEDALWERLSEKDPARAASIHPHNVKRVIRALEIIRETGGKASERAFYSPEPRFESLYLVLTFHDRALLRERIEKRTAAMFSAGLLGEARKIRSLGLPPDATSLQAIGYKELWSAEDPEEAEKTLVLRTSQYAKRQMTWFRGVKDAVPLDAGKGPEALLAEASAHIARFLAAPDKGGNE